MSAAREHWGSRFGFIMAAAGSAVGIGNIWRFPYTTGNNGGGAFLLIYLAMVLGFGIALATAEMLVGRSAQRNPVGAFRILGGKGWPLVGYAGALTGFVILSFYIIVAGWTLAYIWLMASGQLHTTDPEQLNQVFGSFVADPVRPIAYSALFMGLTAWIVAGGIAHGIERWNKVLMPSLFIILLVLVARSLTLPGGMAGVEFYLKPDFSKVTAHTFYDAIAQVFFSLSIGMGTLLTYGSYLSKNEHLPKAALTVAMIDTGVAVLAGLMIMPAVFAFGFNPSAGPGLTFVTLPAVFASMPGGDLFGVLFFSLLAIAALTSAISILEPMVSYFVDEHAASRHKTVIIASLVCFALGIPASLSFGLTAGFTIAGKNWFDLMDFLANNIMLPLGGLLTAIFVGWVWKDAVKELRNQGALSLRWAPLWLLVLRFLAPLGILWIMLSALFG
ncbi:sodium-dependent transporter [Sinimarinibacterium sp. CAU 1509]|uniref:sodium-dependent transporter n=1 Tax=Sinimarinibacterium sp. CAU 1509 TaxID=2562283 RepID=UPI0010ACF0F8|nr:sodium-dependent transporter [Sinimarinibacterium sp. CAU 1509]TJY59360.1 sodium-dependent transporter [Sinimarinibacterium sp. CAU 1509]